MSECKLNSRKFRSRTNDSKEIALADSGHVGWYNFPRRCQDSDSGAMTETTAALALIVVRHVWRTCLRSNYSGGRSRVPHWSCGISWPTEVRFCVAPHLVVSDIQPERIATDRANFRWWLWCRQRPEDWLPGVPNLYK